MNDYNCCGIDLNAWGQWLGLIDEKITLAEAERRIKVQADKLQNLSDMLQLPRSVQNGILDQRRLLGHTREEFWGNFTAHHPSQMSEISKIALVRFEDEGSNPGHAVELGSGISETAINLLHHGWKVTIVDFSPKVIEDMRELVNQWNPSLITNEKLTLVCQNIETFEFPQNVRLILATDLFLTVIQVKLN